VLFTESTHLRPQLPRNRSYTINLETCWTARSVAKARLGCCLALCVHNGILIEPQYETQAQRRSQGRASFRALEFVERALANEVCGSVEFDCDTVV
jgi:hypothetical protein